jgi:peroxiredoxin
VENMEEIKVGESAKNFLIKDQNKEEVKLSSFAGKKVLLSFHPLAWTGICAKQMQSLEAKKEIFDSLNTVALGISVDTVPSKKAWADVLVIRNTQLLSDFWPHGKVAKSYGVFNEESGISKRANIIIDENQKIAFVKVYETKTLPEINEIIDFIKNM